ncbi:hypothetical protein WJR50_28760 [Catalinimonas sp. 4WD22]|uniref:hypothetical protein n=1 Tax=Catalinimonas locisalis TaxID=3133978 RepID=UPI0031012E2A
MLDMNNQSYWTNFEIKLELLRQLDGTSLVFQEKLKQIFLDMRLQNEALESLLKMASRIVESTDAKSRQVFIDNVERVTFDPQLSPISSPPLIDFLRELQRKKAV